MAQEAIVSLATLTCAIATSKDYKMTCSSMINIWLRNRVYVDDLLTGRDSMGVSVSPMTLGMMTYTPIINSYFVDLLVSSDHSGNCLASLSIYIYLWFFSF